MFSMIVLTFSNISDWLGLCQVFSMIVLTFSNISDWLGMCLVFSMVALTFSVCATLCGTYGVRCASSDVRRDTLFKAAVIFLLLVGECFMFVSVRHASI